MREKCQYFTKKNKGLKPQCLHPARTCDFLVVNYLSAPICTKKGVYVFPDVNCVDCPDRFAKCCVEKCPEAEK